MNQKNEVSERFVYKLFLFVMLSVVLGTIFAVEVSGIGPNYSDLRSELVFFVSYLLFETPVLVVIWLVTRNKYKKEI